MANKMERIAQDARQILKSSQEFAEELEHSLIEPEHILLAMTKSNDLHVCKILEDEGIILEKLLPFIRNRLPKGRPLANPISAFTQKTLNLAVDTARRKGHSDIDSTDLLMALMRLEHQGVKEILAYFQADARAIKNALELFWNPNAVIEKPISWNPDAVIEKPVKRARPREMSFWESLLVTFGFGKKKKKR